MNPNPRYIDLYGYIRKIISKNGNFLVFIFQDERFGEVYCKAGRKESGLYYKAEKHKKYHLQVDLKGIKQVSRQGIESVYNVLLVKKVYSI